MPMTLTPGTPEPAPISVPMGQWAVAGAPVLIRTLLGSCLGVVLYDRLAKLGGIAHVVLPDSRGDTGLPGKYVDTAVPALIAEMERAARRPLRGRLTAKLFGGASMFQSTSPGGTLDIGRMNAEAAEPVLAALSVPVIARDLGGDVGRRLTLDTATGIVTVKIPGGAEYER